MSELTEEQKKQQADALELVAKTAETKATEVVNKAFEGKELISKEDAQKQTEEAVNKAVSEAKTELNKRIDAASALAKKASQITRIEEASGMDIEQVIKDAVASGEEVYKNLPKEATLTLKEITTANFTGDALANATTYVRPNLYQSPYSPFWLRNIFPNISVDDGNIVIQQIQGYNGTADVWRRGTGAGGADVEKPVVEPIIKDITVTPEWIAATATVRRELLLNVKYLQSTITNTLLYSRVGLFARENKLIIDYISTNAVAYTGTKTLAVEKLLDAAFGQMWAGYIAPTHILMNNADYLTHIKFNKAAGSGEYDLPNGKLSVLDAQGIERSVTVVPVPDLAPGNAYVIGANEFEFINRLKPEMFVSREHDKNLTLNKVTFLTEEMVAIIAKDLNAMIKVAIPAPPVTP